MTYDEAKQTALKVMSEIPEQIRVMRYVGSNEEFIAIAYPALNDEERALTKKGNYFRWDMLINTRVIEYRQYYPDIRHRLIKAAPKKVPTKQVTAADLTEFLKQQLDYAETARLAERLETQKKG